MTAPSWSIRVPISAGEERSYILTKSSEAAEAAAEPQTATDLIGDKWEGNEKRGVSVGG